MRDWKVRLITFGGAVLLLVSCSDRPTAPTLTKHNVRAQECTGMVIRIGESGTIDTVWTCPQ